MIHPSVFVGIHATRANLHVHRGTRWIGRHIKKIAVVPTNAPVRTAATMQTFCGTRRKMASLGSLEYVIEKMQQVQQPPRAIKSWTNQHKTHELGKTHGSIPQVRLHDIQERSFAVNGKQCNVQERSITSPKPGSQKAHRRAWLIPNMLDKEKSRLICLIADSSGISFSHWHEAGHNYPSYEYAIIDNGNGDGLEFGLGPFLSDFVTSQLLPYVRHVYGAPDLSIASALLRKSSPGMELNHPVPQDIAACATVVVSLSDSTDFGGGLFIQSNPHVNSRHFLQLSAGDVFTHSYDLVHGISIASGCWYSLVFWFRDLSPHTLSNVRSYAEGGDSDAQFNLGCNLFQGTCGFGRDLSCGYDWLRLSAEQGHAEAQYCIGKAHLLGEYVSLSLQEAESWLRRSVFQGHAGSQRLLGELLLDEKCAGTVSKSSKEAILLLQAAAEQGDCAAMQKLFRVYQGHQGWTKDSSKAVRYLRRAAELGAAEAQYELGLVHFEGVLIERNTRCSLEMIKSAASAGVLDAQLLLASLCKRSRDTMDQAVCWLAGAALQGDAEIQRSFGELVLELAHHSSCEGDLVTLGRAWLRVAEIRQQQKESAVPVNLNCESKAARCFDLLLSRPFKWDQESANKGFLQRFLEEFTQQAINSGDPSSLSWFEPSWHFCMDLMSVHQRNDPVFRWGNNKGTVDYPRAVTHDATGEYDVVKKGVVNCRDWGIASSLGKRTLVSEALATLSSEGYVVLEDLLPVDLVEPLEAQFQNLLDSAPEGLSLERLRAGRMQIAMPFEFPWSCDWLVANPLILEIVARYICNNDAVVFESKEDQLWGFLQWVAHGAETGYYLNASAAEKAVPSFGAIDVIYTPAHSMPQLRHRDTNLPGVCATLTLNIPLTPLTPRNGPIGFLPESHRLRNTETEILACPPLGSAILYDSFVGHRGCENISDAPRAVLSLTFDPGVWMRSFDPATGGEASWHHYSAYRRKITEKLHATRAACRGESEWPDEEKQRRCRTGLCQSGSQCRGNRSVEQALLEDSNTGFWYCEHCWDDYLYVRLPTLQQGTPEPRLKPYLGLAGW